MEQLASILLCLREMSNSDQPGTIFFSQKLLSYYTDPESRMHSRFSYEINDISDQIATFVNFDSVWK
jgi:hypothetical protein